MFWENLDWPLIAALVYGLVSDLIGKADIKPNTVPDFVIQFIRGGWEALKHGRSGQTQETDALTHFEREPFRPKAPRERAETADRNP